MGAGECRRLCGALVSLLYTQYYATVVVVAFFRIFENILVITTPQRAPTPELHSASDGLAVPPRPIRTAALRRAGERTGVGAPPWRGGSVEFALPGTARLPPPAFSSSLPAFFFVSNSQLY